MAKPDPDDVPDPNVDPEEILKAGLDDNRERELTDEYIRDSAHNVATYYHALVAKDIDAEHAVGLTAHWMGLVFE